MGDYQRQRDNESTQSKGGGGGWRRLFRSFSPAGPRNHRPSLSSGTPAFKLSPTTQQQQQQQQHATTPTPNTNVEGYKPPSAPGTPKGMSPTPLQSNANNNARSRSTPPPKANLELPSVHSQNSPNNNSNNLPYRKKQTTESNSSLSIDNDDDATNLSINTSSVLNAASEVMAKGNRHRRDEEADFPDLCIECSSVIDERDNLADDDDDSQNKHMYRTSPSPGSSPSSIASPHSSVFPPFKDQLKERAGWLIGLLVLQSCSSFIIQYNEDFLQNHMVIVQFLTMLVGAGGNAGNQAAVGVIRSLALGTLNSRTMKGFLKSEAKMALSLSALIGLTGFIRAALFRTPPGETIAITASVFLIVAISVAIGSTLPLGMMKVGIDPAHSSTSIQVVMDILGVLITVWVCSVVLSFKVFQNEDDDSG